MITHKPRELVLAKSYDKYEDRVYYKENKGFLFSSTSEVHRDRLKESSEWLIQCDNIPDRILVNGEEYSLNKV